MGALRKPLPDPPPPHPEIQIDKEGKPLTHIELQNGEPATFNVDFTNHPENYCEITLLVKFTDKPRGGPGTGPGGTVGVQGP